MKLLEKGLMDLMELGVREIGIDDYCSASGMGRCEHN
jgi:hypothetical protein